MTPLRAGEVVLLGKAASVQFADDGALVLSVISIGCKPTYEGWVWITGYVLDEHNLAKEKREVFVQISSIRRPGPRRHRSGPMF